MRGANELRPASCWRLSVADDPRIPEKLKVGDRVLHVPGGWYASVVEIETAPPDEWLEDYGVCRVLHVLREEWPEGADGEPRPLRYVDFPGLFLKSNSQSEKP